MIFIAKINMCIGYAIHSITSLLFKYLFYTKNYYSLFSHSKSKHNNYFHETFFQHNCMNNYSFNVNRTLNCNLNNI